MLVKTTCSCQNISTYRLAGVTIHRNLATANGIVVRVGSSTWIAIEKSLANRNDGLTVVLDNVQTMSVDLLALLTY